MGYGYSSGASHSYGTQHLPAMWRDQKMRKDEKNREITRVILGMASAGEAADFEDGNPQYEFISSQFGESVAKGMGQKNKRMQAQRQGEKNAAKIERGYTYLDNGFKLEEKVPGNKLTQRFIEEGVALLTDAGIPGLDAKSINNALDSKKELNDKVYEGMVKKIEGVTDLNSLAGARMALAAAAKGMGKSSVEQFDQILDSKQKQFDKEEDRKQDKLKEDREREQDKTYLDGLMDQYNAGRPLGDFPENDQVQLKKELGIKETQGTEKDKQFADWKKIPGNENKNRWDFMVAARAVPSRQINIDRKETFQVDKPTLQENKRIASTVGHMKGLAYKAADAAISADAGLKTAIAFGRKTRDQVAVELMGQYAKNPAVGGNSNAIMYEVDGEYFWAIPDENGNINADSVIADKDGWAK